MPAPSPAPCLSFHKALGAAALLALLAACAQPQQSSVHYDSSRENTKLDAESHVMGSSPRAASQIQLGFGDTGPASPPAPRATDGEPLPEGTVATTLRRPLAEARSFLGTVPCPPGMACEASRFVVTLAPSGEWRARTVLLVGNEPRQTLVEQGCWNVIGDEPLRIALMHDKQDTAKADLSFLNDNTLRVHALNGAQPMLEHRLTRQADIDPIDELKAKPTLKCP